MGSNKIAHLNMVQDAISRMGKNSFSLKEWSVGIMIAVYAFAGNVNSKAVIITIFPLVAFWALDAYYLSMERKFRRLFDEIREKSEKEIDFNMDFKNLMVKMNQASWYSIARSLISKTVLPFYLACVATTLIVYFVNF